jgi:hypothetical protein
VLKRPADITEYMLPDPDRSGVPKVREEPVGGDVDRTGEAEEGQMLAVHVPT